MAEKALSCNLKGYGPVRLSKMTTDELSAVAVALKVDPCSSDVIADILKAKRSLHKESTAAPACGDPPAVEEIAPVETAAPNKPPLADTFQVAKALEIKSAAHAEKPTSGSALVVVKQPEFKIIAFNSYKLRIGERNLTDQWLELITEMSTADILFVSEVPSLQVEQRTSTMKQMLEELSECTWKTIISEPSGTLNEKSNKEVHVVFLRDGVTINKYRTLHEVDGVRLDYAPFQVLAEDSRGVEYVFTSVHFPPESRKSDRHQQMSTFLREYMQNSSVRMDTPFTDKGARDAKRKETVHVIGGDFNAFPPHVARAECVPFSTFIGHRVATSAGLRSHDHFMVNADATEKYLMNADVIQLSAPHNSRASKTGLSDHFPISLTIRHVAQTRRVVYK